MPDRTTQDPLGAGARSTADMMDEAVTLLENVMSAEDTPPGAAEAISYSLSRLYKVQRVLR